MQRIAPPPRRNQRPVKPRGGPRLQAFVARTMVAELAIDVYAAADEGAPESAHYRLYHEGECLNPTEPFWRLPDDHTIRHFLGGQQLDSPRPPAQPRPPRRTCQRQRLWRVSVRGPHRRFAH